MAKIEKKTIRQLLIKWLLLMEMPEEKINIVLNLLPEERQQTQLMDYMAEVRTMDHQLIFRKMEDILTR